MAYATINKYIKRCPKCNGRAYDFKKADLSGKFILCYFLFLSLFCYFVGEFGLLFFWAGILLLWAIEKKHFVKINKCKNCDAKGYVRPKEVIQTVDRFEPIIIY